MQTIKVTLPAATAATDTIRYQIDRTTIATISGYYRPTELLIWIDGFIGRGAFDDIERKTA